VQAHPNAPGGSSNPGNAPPAAPPALDLSVFHAMFDAYPDAVLLVDDTGAVVLANAAASQLLGYSAEQLLRINVDALVPVGVAARHQGLRQGYARAPRPRPMGAEIELTARRADGSEVMVEIALSPVQSAGTHYVIAALRGIGAYPRVQRALQRARYNDYIARAGRAAVDQRDPQQLIARVTALAAQGLEAEAVTVWLLEANRVEFRSASTFAGTADPAIQALAQAITRTSVPNRPDTMLGLVASQAQALVVSNFARENRFNVAPELRDGPLQSALAVPLVDAGPVIGVLVARCIKPARFGADEKNFAESLANLVVTSLQRAQSDTQLAHAQRLEAVGQLTGGIAHDFNNLLTIVHGNLQMLADHPVVVADPSLSQMVSSAVRAGQRGADLTRKLLAFSRRQSLATAELDAGALIKAMADILRRTLGERIKVVAQVSGTCPPCLADAAQLESALLNIAINSRDAMPGGGTLTLSCAPCHDVPAELRAAAHASSMQPAHPTPYIAITVTDTGVGMTREVLDRAFEPFFTTKEPGKGTGLGLSTVYGFVKQSGGHLQVQSKQGAGTSIMMYLPAAPSETHAVARPEGASPRPTRAAGGLHSEHGGQPAPAAAPPHAHAQRATAPEGSLGGRRVLIVEDDEEVRKVAVAFFGAFGATVRSHADADGALAELDAGAEFDLLFSDITLGAGMDGIELAHRARIRAPGLAVLLTSGYSKYLADDDADKLPPWPVLHKPYTREQLLAAARLALRAPAEE
jgi:PAS domain S-box-containing protein